MLCLEGFARTQRKCEKFEGRGQSCRGKARQAEVLPLRNACDLKTRNGRHAADLAELRELLELYHREVQALSLGVGTRSILRIRPDPGAARKHAAPQSPCDIRGTEPRRIILFAI